MSKSKTKVVGIFLILSCLRSFVPFFEVLMSTFTHHGHGPQDNVQPNHVHHHDNIFHMNNHYRDQSSISFPKTNYLSPFAHSVIQEISLIDEINTNIDYMLSNESSNCMIPWPDVVNCSIWFEDISTNKRYLLTNSIPVYFVAPYCPFGVGDGYCFTGKDHKNCSVFKNMTCPAQAHRENTTGDVVVAQLILFSIELNPNPLNNSLPLNIYDKNSWVWAYQNDSNYNISVDIFEYYSLDELEFKVQDRLDNGDWEKIDEMYEFENGMTFYDYEYNYNGGDDSSYSDTTSNSSNTSISPVMWSGYQVIGLHVSGQQIKGPEEAEGNNVDYVGMYILQYI